MTEYFDRNESNGRVETHFAGRGDFHAGGADGFRSPVSTWIVAPRKIGPIELSDLHDKIVAGIWVDNATPQSCLQNGFYDVKMKLHENVWAAELWLDGHFHKNADSVRLIPSSMTASAPEILLLRVNPVGVLVGGIIIGVVIGVVVGSVIFDKPKPTPKPQ